MCIDIDEKVDELKSGGRCVIHLPYGHSFAQMTAVHNEKILVTQLYLDSVDMVNDFPRIAYLCAELSRHLSDKINLIATDLYIAIGEMWIKNSDTDVVGELITRMENDHDPIG